MSPVNQSHTNTDVDTLNLSVCEGILDAARKAIQKKGGKRVKKIFPWWAEECDKAVKFRNKAFKMLKRNHSFQNLIEYKRMQAHERQVIKSTKHTYSHTHTGKQY